MTNGGQVQRVFLTFIYQDLLSAMLFLQKCPQHNVLITMANQVISAPNLCLILTIAALYHNKGAMLTCIQPFIWLTKVNISLNFPLTCRWRQTCRLISTLRRRPMEATDRFDGDREKIEFLWHASLPQPCKLFGLVWVQGANKCKNPSWDVSSDTLDIIHAHRILMNIIHLKFTNQKTISWHVSISI